MADRKVATNGALTLYETDESGRGFIELPGGKRTEVKVVSALVRGSWDLYAGDLAKGDFDGHPFRGNQYVDGAAGVPGEIVDELRGLDHEVSYTLDGKGEVVSRVDGEVGFVEVETKGKSGLHTIHNHTDGSTTASIADLRWLGTISGVDRLSVVSAGGVQTIRVVDRREMWVSAGKWSANINTRIADGFMDGKIDKKSKTKYLNEYTAEAIKSMEAAGVIEVTFDPTET